MSILRTLHNKKNPYVTLNKAVLWDESISLRAKGLWAQCLSRPDDWTFHVKEVASHGKESLKAIYAIIKELMDAGYVLRFEDYESSGHKTLKKTTEYLFLEFKPSIEELEELKKSFRRTHFRHVEDRRVDTGNILLSKDLNQSSLPPEVEEEKKESLLAPTSSSPSSDAESLTDFFLSKIREEDPNFREPNRKKWSIIFDRMLRIDKRSVEDIEHMICWVRQDVNSKPYNLSPDSLRKNFDQNKAFMAKDAIKNRIRYNRDWAKEAKQKYAEHLKGMSFDNKFVYNTYSGTEVLLDLPHDSFVAGFKSIFGGR